MTYTFRTKTNKIYKLTEYGGYWHLESLHVSAMYYTSLQQALQVLHGLSDCWSKRSRALFAGLSMDKLGGIAGGSSEFGLGYNQGRRV